MPRYIAPDDLNQRDLSPESQKILSEAKESLTSWIDDNIARIRKEQEASVNKAVEQLDVEFGRIKSEHTDVLASFAKSVSEIRGNLQKTLGDIQDNALREKIASDVSELEKKMAEYQERWRGVGNSLYTGLKTIAKTALA